MNNLDFDIKKYSINELYELLGVTNKNNKEDIRMKINKFKDASNKIPENRRFEYSQFIDQLSNILVGEISGAHPFINRPIKPVINASTDGNELSHGIINPLNKTYLNRIINIDTRFRDNYYTTKSTDFIINLPTNLGKVVSMNLVALEMQTTFYTFSEQKRTNFFWVTLTSGGTPYTQKIIIPDGNYTDVVTYRQVLNANKLEEEQSTQFLTDMRLFDGNNDNAIILPQLAVDQVFANQAGVIANFSFFYHQAEVRAHHGNINKVYHRWPFQHLSNSW